MNILGIHEGHNATAALLQDGSIVAVCSEERFTRHKNQSGLPLQSIRYCLEYAKIEGNQIDQLVFAGSSWPNYVASLESSGQTTSHSYAFYHWLRRLSELLHVSLLQFEYMFPFLKGLNVKKSHLQFGLMRYFLYPKLKKILYQQTNIPPTKMVTREHHLCHAAAAIYSSPLRDTSPVLVITADGGGDGLCATVSIYKKGQLRRVLAIGEENSLGAFYAGVTEYLGMKPLEHEYKVMGLAPYAQAVHTDKIYKLFRNYIHIDPERLSFVHKYTPDVMRLVLRHDLVNVRFDIVAGATQKFTEMLLLEWITALIRKYQIHRLVLGGGIFMNVKVNMLIAQLPQVKDLYVMPSAGDESNAIGAAYLGYLEHTKKPPQPLTNLYLGPEFTGQEIERTLNEFKTKFSFRARKMKNAPQEIATLLAKKEIVAIFLGRMEFGARALGNRSILANASGWETVATINRLIKSRDFWMPFAPVILDTWENKYIQNPKKIRAEHMMFAFPATPLAQKHLQAAMHPYDKTLRPQIIHEQVNPFYYHILKEYERVTGMGGCLNTSFNLHGEPIVCTPADALSAFQRSGLKYLALGNYLLSKK